MEPPTAPGAADAGVRGPVAVPRTTSRAAAGLLVALLLACLYAAFANGAADQPGSARLEVAVAAFAAIAAATWAGLGERMRARTTREGWIGLGCLAAFAAWAGLSLAWSVAPDSTWEAFNRLAAYALVAGLGLIVGTRAARAVERTSLGLLAVAALVAIYALLTLVVPGLDLGGGLLDLDRAGIVPRLIAPVGTWEGLALVCVLGLGAALRLAADEDLRDATRLTAFAVGFLLASVVGIADAPVAYLAGGVALTLTIVLGRLPLRTAVVALAQVLLAVPIVLAARGLDVGSGPVRTLDARESDGLTLLITLAVYLVAALVLAWLALKWVRDRPREGSTAFPAMLAGGLAALLLAGLVLGLTTGALLDVDQGRAIGLDGGTAQTRTGDRTTWWSEAIGSASAAPVGGHGAGSFAVEHLQRRTQPDEVVDAHSLPLGVLSDTGVVGLLLLVGGLVGLGWAATRRVLATPAGRERDLAATLLAGTAAWLVHALFEPDLSLPAVTVPALLALGVLAARPVHPVLLEAPPRRAILADPREASRGRGGRMLLGALAVLCLATVAAAAALPSVAADKTAEAREAAASGTVAGLQEGAADADLAARLDPLGVQPLLAGAAIAQRRGATLGARSLLLEAVRRQPQDAGSWARLAQLSGQALDLDGAVVAATRAARLDPASPATRELARRAQAALVPPSLSATATATPLGSADAVETVPGG